MNDKQAGDFTDIVSTSFFPAKPLGCYGDGGALLTNDDELADFVTVPHVPEGVVSTWAQYTIQFDKRDELQAKLKQANVPSVVYYAKPLHQQTAYKDYPVGGNGLHITNKLASNVLNCPCIHI